MFNVRILVLIVLAQLLCTSVWFAGNAVAPELIREFALAPGALGTLTSSVQLGFISGTLVFAILTLADRLRPSRLFFLSALAAALCNAAVIFQGQGALLLLLRFLTGFFLAGIYPVGMKIAADHFGSQLGKALGFLVGALVLGTALPHLVKSVGLHLSWKLVFVTTTALVLAGGTLMLIGVPDGAHRRPAAGFDLRAVFRVFGNSGFRAPAFAYFGHMWELYAFWAFLPLLLTAYNQTGGAAVQVPLWSFLIIAAGSLGCAGTGLLSPRLGSRRLAALALLGSGVCCLAAPLAYRLPPGLFLAFLLFWGFTVVADSPMFSSMVAARAPAENRGTALTIVNCIGFAITILSIQLLSYASALLDGPYLSLLLAPGPALGLYALFRKGSAKVPGL